ncbi:unnamed protein product [Linum tenue]|uniref:Uncharacterized protein n=1 Tax=Linum tenue TaxID=586396 RepID=A0AAV0JWX4_9ROSI|nr:unnamed protein product [Linum tenue]
MSCPHLSGVATLVKSAHPNWSPAAIKSAILTTAYKYDRGDRSISTEQNVSASMFDMGSGHVNLSMALSPGLVYDIQPDDYIPYLCGLGYGDTEIRLIVQRKVNCSNVSSIPEAQLNYPTFSISLGSDDQKTFTRTVTNVGLPNSTYTCKEVLSPEGVDVKVMPYKIEFKDLNEKASYSVTFTKLGNVTRTKVSEGHLIWSSADEKSKVVSAIVEAPSAPGKTGLQTYIVFLDKPEGSNSNHADLRSWYTTFLPETTLTTNEERIVHSYRNVVTGFAAKLTPQEARAMEDKAGFVSARVQRSLSLLTTRTPEFLGLQQSLGAWNLPNSGEGVIIGVIDTGINHGHPSFSDEGMPPPPSKWRGRCEFNGKRICNNKLIGARSFLTNTTPSEDVDFYHGSHTAGEAAGSPVQGANVFGQANGTAMGIAPKAHLAMYKICLKDECFESGLLAAMDAAIEDGVDVLSLSITDGSSPFYDNTISLGAFRAIQSGIFVSCSAGNEGPSKSSVVNDAPWILTVGASTIDREIRATVLLGNNVELHGQSAYQPKDLNSRQLPIIDPAATGINASATFCGAGSLNNIDVKGKIVLCQIGGEVRTIEKGQEVKDHGGAAMILINDLAGGYTTLASAHVLPASHINYQHGLAVKGYLTSTQLPTASISFGGTLIGKSNAPQVAFFSSRGPSPQSPGILKPDIIGPGVNILAAWGASVDNATNSFNVVSGTSMSCPHLSGVAALIKSAHPDWSPAAIKSAILTTAYTINRDGSSISTEQNVSATVFDLGSGHVNPPTAMNPGLVYDLHPDDFVPYLCGLGYDDKAVRLIVQRKVNCSMVPSIPEAQLNYPTFSISLHFGDQKTYTRTVTNVGLPNSTYTYKALSLEGVDVKVMPKEIKFRELKEKASFSVKFTRFGNAMGSSSVSEGHLVWSSNEGEYNVVSAIVVVFV